MPQNSRTSGASEDLVQRDYQQIQDDNQTSGESVLSGQTSGDNQQPLGTTDSPNGAADRDAAEGSRAPGGAKGGSDA